MAFFITFHKNIRYLFFLCIITTQAQTLQKPFYFFEERGKKGLKNNTEEIIIPAKYDQLGWTNAVNTPVLLKNTIGYKFNNFWGIMNLSHKKITDPIYDGINILPNNFLLVSFKSHNSTLSHFGIIDEQNNIQIPIQYFHIQLVNPQKNIYIVSSFLKNQPHYGLISHARIIVPLEYKKITPFSKNIYKAVSFQNTITLFYEEGDKVFPQEYDNIIPLNADIFITQKEENYGIRDKNGIIIQKDIYKNITKINDTLLKIEPYSQWFLLNEENTTLQSFLADEVLPLQNSYYKIKKKQNESIFTFPNSSKKQTNPSLIPLKKNNSYEIFDTQKNKKLPMQFQSVIVINKNIFAATQKRNQWDIYNSNGQQKTFQKFQSLIPLNTEFIASKKFDLWGLLHHSLENVFPHIYDTILPPRFNLFPIQTKNKWGIKDRYKTDVLIPLYDSVNIVSHNIIAGTKKETITFFNRAGNPLINVQKYTLVKKYIIFEAEKKKGVLDLNGIEIFPPIYDSLFFTDNNTLVITKKEKIWNIETTQRIPIIQGSFYEHIKGCSEGLIAIKKDKKYGFVDTKNKMVIVNRYEDVELFSEGLAAVKILHKWGFINTLENIVIQNIYQGVSPFLNGNAIAKFKNKYILLDTQGKNILDIELDTLSLLKPNVYLLKKNKKYGIYNSLHKKEIYPLFDTIIPISHTFLLVKNNKKYGIINTEGMHIIPTHFDKILSDTLNNIFVCKQKNAFFYYSHHR